MPLMAKHIVEVGTDSPCASLPAHGVDQQYFHFAISGLRRIIYAPTTKLFDNLMLQGVDNPVDNSTFREIIVDNSVDNLWKTC